VLIETQILSFRLWFFFNKTQVEKHLFLFYLGHVKYSPVCFG
jgi:hypothetical protein